MDHPATIATISGALDTIPGIRALFLSGSHGTGLADACSDIDFVLVADDGPTDTVAAHWREAVARTGEIVLWWDRTVRPALINAITADWTRTDVVILKPDQMRGHTQASLKPVFDHDGLFATLPAETPPPRSAPPASPTSARSSSGFSASSPSPWGDRNTSTACWASITCAPCWWNC